MLTQYFFYYITLAPHPHDSTSLKVLHLKGIYSAIKGYAKSFSQYHLNEVEDQAAVRYYKHTLPKIYSPTPDHRFPIRMCLLLKCWTERARGITDLSKLPWIDLRDRNYQAVAHQEQVCY